MASPARAPGVYHDNLAEARARGTAHTGDGHGSPTITNEAKREVSRFLEDPIYRINLLRRFRQGEGGALEVWFWRWKLGDPKPAKDASDEGDQKRFKEIRAEVMRLIQENRGRHDELEAEILGALPEPAQLLAGSQVEAAEEDE